MKTFQGNEGYRKIVYFSNNHNSFNIWLFFGSTHSAMISLYENICSADMWGEDLKSSW